MSRIMIPIDHKWRDLPGNVYAGILLENMVHKVKYVRIGLEKYYIPSFKPDLLLLVHLYDKERQIFAREMSDAGIKIVLAPTEGIPTLDEYRPFAAGISCDLSSVDLHFSWNQTMADLINENPTIERKKIEVIGVNRFDFYHKPLSTLLKSKINFCRENNFDSSLPIITFATNFTQASFYTKQQDFMEKDAEKLGYKKIMDEMHGGPREIAKKDYKSREILLNAFIDLVRTKKNVNFILKTHPSEDHQYYKEKIKTALGSDIKRVAIITTAYIWDVLNVTDILLKRSCTTGVEAWMLGLPTIEMKLNPEEWYFSEEHASGSDVVNTYSKLELLIDDYLNGKLVDQSLLDARKKFITKWCFNNDGNATKKMVGLIDVILKEKQPKRIKKLRFKNYLFYKLLLVGDYFIHDIRVYGFLNTIRKRYIDKLGRDDKFFHEQDIKLWKKKINSVLDSQ